MRGSDITLMLQSGRASFDKLRIRFFFAALTRAMPDFPHPEPVEGRTAGTQHLIALLAPQLAGYRLRP